ncbi:hypothetical protein AKJ56_00180 [candidate division MSBL1 archaeon SCGC-AAA382N08]|uniref:Uncharacterized protein n=1 Tax=candidate division MSBL1 archaeon SCGC-AAA382N08 TaxID=1698285 RepID=A0A133VR12_9EURY|nr:hypothetical protein AKJ56_00180 [candidate division MSBL1 archaeon SCGC-AAA382N08]
MGPLFGALSVLSGIGILATLIAFSATNKRKHKLVSLGVFLLCFGILTWLILGITAGSEIAVNTKNYRYRAKENGSFLSIPHGPGFWKTQEGKKEVVALLKKRGLLGIHPLKVQFYDRGVSGDFSGGFLTGTSGTLKQEGNLQFAWFLKDKGREMFISSFPSEKIKFVWQEDLEQAQVRFKFNLNKLDLYNAVKDNKNNLAELISEEWIDYIVARIPNSSSISNLFRLRSE